MGYFSKFPRTNYSFDDGITNKIAVDILQRVGFKQSIKDNGKLFIDYHIKDGDTPEMVAHAIYGDSELHWVILLFNDIIDPYWGWHRDTNTLENMIKGKYKGKAFFTTALSGTADFTDVNFVRNQTVFGVSGGTFTDVDSITFDNDKKGLIDSWDKSLSKMVVTGVTGSGSFAVDDFLVSWGVSADGSTFNIAARLSRLVDTNYDALHHFEDPSTGNILNPYGTPPDANGEQTLMGGTAGNTHDGFSGGTTFANTVLQNYVVDSTDTYTITNYEMEYHRNDNIKTIKIIRPDMLQHVIKEFENLMQGR